MEVGLCSGHIVVDGDPAPLSKKGAQPPILGPCLLWPNGWMDQDATLYNGRPGQHCVRCGPSSTPRGTPPNFGPCLLWPNGCMDQDATWYEGRYRPSRIVLHGDPAAASQKGHSPPIFGPCLLWPNYSPQFLDHVYCGQICLQCFVTVGWAAGRASDL